MLERVVNFLFLKAGTLKRIGLVEGKLGVAIFFYYLYNETKENRYKYFAEELMGHISILPNNLDYSLQSGLPGIGFGILNLIRNGLVEGNEDVILEELDKKVKMHILTAGPAQIQSVIDSVLYIITRINNNRTHHFSGDLDKVIHQAFKRINAFFIHSRARASQESSEIPHLKILLKSIIVFTRLSKTSYLDLGLVNQFHRTARTWFKGRSQKMGMIQDPLIACQLLCIQKFFNENHFETARSITPLFESTSSNYKVNDIIKILGHKYLISDVSYLKFETGFSPYSFIDETQFNDSFEFWKSISNLGIQGISGMGLLIVARESRDPNLLKSLFEVVALT